MRTIEIDFDIHKLIEAERRSFDEEPYVALRRLLKLPEPARELAKPAGRALRSEGVTREHGSKLRVDLRPTQAHLHWRDLEWGMARRGQGVRHSIRRGEWRCNHEQ